MFLDHISHLLGGCFAVLVRLNLSLGDVIEVNGERWVLANDDSVLILKQPHRRDQFWPVCLVIVRLFSCQLQEIIAEEIQLIDCYGGKSFPLSYLENQELYCVRRLGIQFRFGVYSLSVHEHVQRINSAVLGPAN